VNRLVDVLGFKLDLFRHSILLSFQCSPGRAFHPMNEMVFIQMAQKNKTRRNDNNKHGCRVIMTSKAGSLDCEQICPRHAAQS